MRIIMKDTYTDPHNPIDRAFTLHESIRELLGRFIEWHAGVIARAPFFHGVVIGALMWVFIIGGIALMARGCK